MTLIAFQCTFFKRYKFALLWALPKWQTVCWKLLLKSRQNMYGETFPLDAYFRVTDCFFINLQKIDRLTSCNSVLWSFCCCTHFSHQLVTFTLQRSSPPIASSNISPLCWFHCIFFSPCLTTLSFLSFPHSQCLSFLMLIHLWSFTALSALSFSLSPFFPASPLHFFCPWLPRSELLAVSPCHWVMDYLHANGSAWKD